MTLKRGDLVKLLSGGPTMVVVRISRSGEFCKCAYDASGMIQETKWLPLEALVRRLS